MKKSIYKIKDNLYKCECGREFNNSQSLNAHFSHCDYHHECLGTKRKGHYTEINKTNAWNKSFEEMQKISLKSLKTRLKNIAEGKTIIKGHKCSEETKNKLRIIQANKLKDKGLHMNYSIKACKYINELNKKNNWNLQHAENGGEIECLGYWLDGYDKDLNIVFEYDEPKHYIDKENNILRDYDIKRQIQIIEKLKCEFWRYNEFLDLLYKVN